VATPAKSAAAKPDTAATQTTAANQIHNESGEVVQSIWNPTRGSKREFHKPRFNLFLTLEIKRQSGNNELVLEVLAQDGMFLEDATDEQNVDEEVVLVAIKRNGYAFQFASERLQSDKDFVLKAVKQDGEALCYAKISADRAHVVQRVEVQGSPAASHGTDRDVFLNTVRFNGHALSVVSGDLKADEEFVWEAVRRSGLAL